MIFLFSFTIKTHLLLLLFLYIFPSFLDKNKNYGKVYRRHESFSQQLFFSSFQSVYFDIQLLYAYETIFFYFYYISKIYKKNNWGKTTNNNKRKCLRVKIKKYFKKIFFIRKSFFKLLFNKIVKKIYFFLLRLRTHLHKIKIKKTLHNLLHC